MIWAIIVLELESRGRRETSSFQALSRGMICIAETIASPAGVLNNVGVVTKGSGPRIRPSWLMRSPWVVKANVELSKIARTPRHTLLPDCLFLFSMIFSSEKLGEGPADLFCSNICTATAEGGKSQNPSSKSQTNANRLKVSKCPRQRPQT